jgi:hypothetical protein
MRTNPTSSEIAMQPQQTKTTSRLNRAIPQTLHPLRDRQTQAWARAYAAARADLVRVERAIDPERRQFATPIKSAVLGQIFVAWVASRPVVDVVPASGDAVHTMSVRSLAWHPLERFLHDWTRDALQARACVG